MTSESGVQGVEVIESDKRYRNLSARLKLLISLNKVEFSYLSNGYYRVTRDIFVSGLPFLLYVRGVSVERVGSDFEVAKEKVKRALVHDLEVMKLNLVSSVSTNGKEGNQETEEVGIKIRLLDQGISIFGDR